MIRHIVSGMKNLCQILIKHGILLKKIYLYKYFDFIYYDNFIMACVAKIVQTDKDKDDIKHITEAFYRVDKARERSEGRTGIGLFLCKQIVDIHNGSMSVVSEIDSGTEFTISLPFRA